MKNILFKLKKYGAYLIALITVLLFVTVPIAARADFGDFGGGGDYGGGGGGDYGGSYSSDYSSSDGEIGFIDMAIAIIIVVVAVIIITTMSKRKSSGKAGSSRPAGATPTPTSSLKPMSSYAQVDPGFREGEFKEKLSNLYVQMQQGWTAKDIESVRPYFTDAYFTQMERQLNAHKAANRTNYVDRIAVLGVEPKGWKQEGGLDHIIVTMRTRIVDYLVDDKTGKIISGSNTAEKFMVYEWDLCRTSGKITGKDDGITRTNCPACGAPLDVNASARCEYCGSVINSGSFNWALCQIKGISQTTR